jgi:hypothetical protein
LPSCATLPSFVSRKFLLAIQTRLEAASSHQKFENVSTCIPIFTFDLVWPFMMFVALASYRALQAQAAGYELDNPQSDGVTRLAGAGVTSASFVLKVLWAMLTSMYDPVVCKHCGKGCFIKVRI